MSILDNTPVLDRRMAKFHRTAKAEEHHELALNLLDSVLIHLDAAREKHGAIVEKNTAVVSDLRADTTDRLAKISEANKLRERVAPEGA